jgi:hypothetical protein
MRSPYAPCRQTRAAFCLLLLLLASTPHFAQAETKLDFWHSYVHQPSGVTHYSFQIARYKRGLFFGSCGPSTRSLQWEYDIDLTGTGPLYHKQQVTVTSEGKKVEVVSGTITIDFKQNQATIDLQLKVSGADLPFQANGTHPILKMK